MLCRVATIMGAVFGWVGAVAIAVTGVLPHERAVPVMLLGLSLALICSACMALQRHQRPLGAAFELGYDMGRRDAMREANTGNVRQMKTRTTRRLSEFDSVGS